jgi:hypothetical protein
MISRKSEYEREIVDKDAIVDRDAVEQAVQAAMASAGVGQLNLGSLGTSGQSVMEGEPITLAADPVAPVFDRSDVAGSLAAGLVPTQADILQIYTPYLFGYSSGLEKTFNDVRALEEAGYALKEAAPTSTISHFEMNDTGGGKFIPKTSGLTESESPMSTMVEPEVTPMDSDIDRAVAAAVASAVASGGDMPVQVADDPVMAAVETAVGNGQPTTDDTILDPDDMVVGAMVVTPYYNPVTGETFDQTNTAQPVPEGFIPVPEGGIPTTTETPAQPDFMTQLNELIASMQAEQTAAAEAQAAAEAERQKQAAEMTQNYTIGQPAVGYNPYESGQYQNNPYGSAGVPDMGGITSIPVPAAYTPNPYLTGGMT